jgi:hypothetical protein
MSDKQAVIDGYSPKSSIMLSVYGNGSLYAFASSHPRLAAGSLCYPAVINNMANHSFVSEFCGNLVILIHVQFIKEDI